MRELLELNRLLPLTPALSPADREKSSANPQLLFVPRAGLGVSLSPRERAGGEGKEDSASTMVSLISGSGAHGA